MATIANGRMTHQHDGELVVFLIGMRFNRPWRVDKWLPAFVAMPRMLAEHNAIVEALKELGRAATVERHPEVSRFVDELRAHAQNEEQVLYPAAIVVGEYMKLKFRGSVTP